MIPNRLVLWLLLLSVTTASVAQEKHGSAELTPSAHRSGPNGLEGWTLEEPIPDQPNNLPFTLIIARNGKEIRRFDGEGFVWRWKFLPDGQARGLRVRSNALRPGLRPG